MPRPKVRSEEASGGHWLTHHSTSGCESQSPPHLHLYAVAGGPLVEWISVAAICGLQVAIPGMGGHRVGACSVALGWGISSPRKAGPACTVLLRTAH